jgi:hypothetical protein
MTNFYPPSSPLGALNSVDDLNQILRRPPKIYTTDVTASIGDIGSTVFMNSALSNSYTIPRASSLVTPFPLYAEPLVIVQMGAGATLVQFGAGTTVNGVASGSISLAAPGDMARLWQYAPDTWIASTQASGTSGASQAGGLEFRGVSIGSSYAIQGFNNGAGLMSRCTRARKLCLAPFRYYRVVIPVIYPFGSPVIDTFLSGTWRFQHGMLNAHVDASTGLPARRATTFSGATQFEYVSSTWDTAVGWFISDLMDAGSTIEAGNFFEEYLTIETTAPGTNILPYVRNGTNILQRRICVNDTATSQIAAYGGASDVALTATSMTQLGTGAGGASNYYMPTFIIGGIDPTIPVYGLLGDSIAYGVGEGATASQNAIGDPLGAQNGAAGCYERWLASYGRAFCSLSRGSDRVEYVNSDTGRALTRKLMAQVLNPDSLIIQLGFNDLSNSAATTWGATTAYTKYQCLSTGTRAYMVTVAGTSGASAPTIEQPDVVDGTCHLRFLGTISTVEQGAAWGLLCRQKKLIDQMLALKPGITFKAAKLTPNATSTDAFATTVNQTTSVIGWDAGERRDYYNDLLDNGIVQAWLPINQVLDANAGIESTPHEGKWAVDGSANYNTFDGTHPNSGGALRGSQSTGLPATLAP